MAVNSALTPNHLQESYSVRTNESNKVVLKSINLKSPNVSATKKKVQKKRTAKLVDLKKQGTNDDLN